jgi:hypothetical protein
VADELYANPLPLIAVAESDFALLQTGDQIWINDNGVIHVSANH